MASKVQRHFKAKVKSAKLKATPTVEDEEIVVEDALVVVTLHVKATKMNLRLLDFLNGAKDQKEVDVTIESSQMELAL